MGTNLSLVHIQPFSFVHNSKQSFLLLISVMSISWKAYTLEIETVEKKTIFSKTVINLTGVRSNLKQEFYDILKIPSLLMREQLKIPLVPISNFTLCLAFTSFLFYLLSILCCYSNYMEGIMGLSDRSLLACMVGFGITLLVLTPGLD